MVIFGDEEENAPGPVQLITYGGTPPLGFAFADPLQVPLQVALVLVGVTVKVGGRTIATVLVKTHPFVSVIVTV